MNSLPTNDVDLDVDVLDVFLPFGISNFALVPRSPTSGASASTAKPSLTRNNKNEKTVGSAASTLYCSACKKKFSNEATWKAHLKSAKHVQNEKTAGKSGQTSEGQITKNSQQASPAVAQAHVKLKQAMNVASSKPSLAAGALWALAKEFYKLKRPRDAAQIMTDLIKLLEDLQTQPSKSPEDGALTSAQISGTLYLTRLALARLYLIYCDQGLLELSRGIFLKAIHSKWRIDEQKLNETASECRDINHLLKAAEELLHIYVEKVLSKPAKTKADANQVLLTILMEGQYLFSISRAETMSYKQDQGASHPLQVAAAMCAMSICIHNLTGNKNAEVAEYQTLSKLYLNLGAQGSAVEALMRCSLTAFARYLPGQEPISIWIHAMKALVICLEMDDIVLAEEIMHRVHWDSKLEDVKVLMEFSRAFVETNHLLIQQVIYYQIAHVGLRLRNEISIDNLLLNNVEKPERLLIWDRIEAMSKKFNPWM
ncbi:unnamed protein product [Umbelopsis vinacea]